MADLLRGPIGPADCQACPFAKDGRPSNPVRGIGPSKPLFIVVGEAPTLHETRIDALLVGPAGELVQRACRDTGVRFETVWRTTAIACVPTAKADEKMRHAAAACCSQRLAAELAAFPGKPVLTLGGIAAKAVLGDATDLSITQIASTHFEVDGRDIIPTTHPSAILRSQGDDATKEKTGGHTTDLGYWALQFDILKVAALARGEDIRMRMRPGVEIFTELDDSERARNLVWERLCEARSTGTLAIDLETTVGDDLRNFALQAFVAKIKLLGLASGGVACSVRWDLLDSVMVDEFVAVLADASVAKVFHNATYDIAVLENQWYGFKVDGPIEDTLLMQHAAWPGAPKGLQRVTSQFRAVPSWKSDFRSKGDSLEDEAQYNAADVRATLETLPVLHFWVKKSGTEKVYDVDRVKSAFARQMHLRGYYVDPDVNAEIKRRLSKIIDESNAAIIGRYDELRERVHHRLCAEQAKTKRKADPDDYGERIAIRAAELEKKVAKGKFKFSPSNDWHAVALLKACGVQLWKTTPSGRTATGGDILEKLSQHPEVDALINLRANEMLLDTFITRMFEWVQDSQKKWRAPHVQDDGRVHPLWAPVQISGRFSSQDPASSNWSEGDESNKDPTKCLPNIRRQLVAPPGRVFVYFDYSALEARLMAVQSGDPFLCRVFRDGLDIHHEIGSLVFKEMLTLPRKDPRYVKLRTISKGLGYASLYGGSDAVVHKQLSANEPSLAGPQGFRMVQAAIVKIRQAVGGLTQWQQKLLRAASAPPYTIRSYLHGRMRIFPLGNPPPTDTSNFPQQSTGADVIDQGLCRFVPRMGEFRDAFGVLHQHDALIFEVDEDEAPRVAKVAKECFETSIVAADGKEIAFPIELKIGGAYHEEPSDEQKAKNPDLIWPVGRSGLVSVKL